MKLGRILATVVLICAVSFFNVCSAAALKYGDRGDEVKEIQTYLIAQCLLQGEADGVYGSSTVKAIKDFQSALGLDADGVCGTITYKVLRAAAYDEIDIYNFSLNDFLANDNGDYDVKTIVEPEENYGGDSEEIYYGGSEEVPEFSRVVRVEATAYSRFEDGMSNYTARGNFCQRGVIAVDPSVIPLGTKVFIPGYGYAVADDVGGAIVGNIIDIAFDSVEECYQWGRQFIDLYIID
ncbi:MAG: peptidoglycan-binding protein [Selenomonadaceae bacterium]|nr:peptidoglycan-binding protein [Selenomonadaceae bacterium]